MQILSAWLLSFSLLAGCMAGCRQQEPSSLEDSQSLTSFDGTTDTAESIPSNTVMNTESNAVSAEISNGMTEENSMITNASLTSVTTITPANGTYNPELKPTFTWKGADAAASYILVAEKYQ